MSLISCLIITSLISYHSSHVSSLRHSSHVTQLMSHHHVTDLVSHHYITPTKLLPIYSWVATFNFCQWHLPTSHRIILPVTYAHPLRSILCTTLSVLLPRRIGIGFQGVSHLSQFDLMSLISCLIITSLSLASRIRKGLSKGFTKGFRKGNSQKVYGQSQVITCHSSHVTHLMSLISCLITSLISCHSSHVTHLMSLISCFIIMSLISCHSSHVSISCHSSHVSISCHSSHVTPLMSHHYVTHLMSHHYVTHVMAHHYVTDTKLLPIYSRVATFYFCPWPLPTSHRIIIPVTSAHPLRCNWCPARSVVLPRRAGIGFEGVSHSSPTRSHVTHLMSHHYVIEPGLKG